MYGKYFDSTFTGSMMGAGPTVFAVWGYVIANAIEGQVEINPKLLAVIIGTTEEDIAAAICYLEAPDVSSRTPDEEGRRMIREGQFAYRVVNHSKYKELKSEDQRREYMRDYMRNRRSKPHVNEPVNLQLAGLAHTDTEADTEAKTEITFSPLDVKFNYCWKLYPRKLGRGKALKSFRSQIKSAADYEAICRAIDNFKTDMATLGTAEQFMPYGSTFFNEGWRDYVPGIYVPANPPRPSSPPSKSVKFVEFTDETKM